MRLYNKIMGKYLAIYHGAANDEDKKQTSAEKAQAFMEAWATWAQHNKGALVDPGSPLYRKKVVTADNIEDIEDTKTGYTIIEAESHDDAVNIFKSHPHLSLFEGNSIEILECPASPK